MKVKIKKPVKIKSINNNIKDIKSCALEWAVSICCILIGYILIAIGIGINDIDGLSLFVLIPGIVLELIGGYLGLKSCYHFLQHIDRLQNIEDNILMVNKNLENIDRHICEGFNWLSENITEE